MTTPKKDAYDRRITARQVGGDDGYCWAVLVDGREFVNGLTRREIPYYKKQAKERLIAKEGPLTVTP